MCWSRQSAWRDGGQAIIRAHLMFPLTGPVLISARFRRAAPGAFLGKWALTLNGPQGVFEQSVVVKDEAKVLFDINGGQFSMSGTGVKK